MPDLSNVSATWNCAAKAARPTDSEPPRWSMSASLIPSFETTGRSSASATAAASRVFPAAGGPATITRRGFLAVTAEVAGFIWAPG